MIKQTKKLFWKLLEEELTAVLAVLIIGLGVVFVYAGNTGTTTMSLTVYPAGGSITVTAPDGGESWAVGSSQNITWTSLGPINDVKIEIQRVVAGSWATIIESTTDDGTYPWTVTSPTTTAATIKISKVGDDTINDSSDSTFSIVQAAGGGGGYSLPQPAVNDVAPSVVANNAPTVLDITGFNFKRTVTFQLDRVILTNIEWIDATHAKATVPAGVTAGGYRLWVYNNDGTYSYWGSTVQVVEQMYEATVSPTELNLYMNPEERQSVEFEFINTGNSVWGNTLKLGTIDPQDRISIFHDPISWVATNRPASYQGESLGYGGKTTLSFYMKAPDAVGQYTEKFALLLEGNKWLNMQPVVINILVTAADEELPSTGGDLFYSAQWTKQSPYLTLKPNQEADVWVEFKNIGTLPWYNSGTNSVRLGTSNPLDRESRFSNGRWLSSNRATVVNGLSAARMDGHSIDPGEIGRFTFRVKAPSRMGDYREYFRPVVEFKEWLPDFGVYWDFHVTGSTISTPPPTTGGESAPTTTEPIDLENQLFQFSDTSEGFLSGLLDSIGRLFGGISNLFSDWF